MVSQLVNSLSQFKAEGLQAYFDSKIHRRRLLIRKAETDFIVIAVKAMLSATQVPWDESHKMWGEVAKTATSLDNLIA